MDGNIASASNSDGDGSSTRVGSFLQKACAVQGFKRFEASRVEARRSLPRTSAIQGLGVGVQDFGPRAVTGCGFRV